MIGRLIAQPEAMSMATTGQAAAWKREQDGSNTHLPEPNVAVVQTTGGAPTVNPNTRLGFEGIRAIRARLVRVGIPLLPLGPAKVALRGPGYRNAGRPPQPVRATTQFVPVVSPSSSGDWWEFLV